MSILAIHSNRQLEIVLMSEYFLNKEIRAVICRIQLMQLALMELAI